MKGFFKWFFRTLLILFVASGIWIGANWSHLSVFPSIISSFSSKMICSCLHVNQHDEAFCKNYARQYVPIQSVQIDTKNKTVTVKGLWRTNQARYIGKRQGCMLQKLH